MPTLHRIRKRRRRRGSSHNGNDGADGGGAIDLTSQSTTSGGGSDVEIGGGDGGGPPARKKARVDGPPAAEKSVARDRGHDDDDGEEGVDGDGKLKASAPTRREVPSSPRHGGNGEVEIVNMDECDICGDGGGELPSFLIPALPIVMFTRVVIG